jgi:hypothetical protein
MGREFMKIEITCGSDTLVSATWSPITGFSPYHEAIRLLRQVNEKMQKHLRSSFMRGYESLEIELDDLDRYGIPVMAQFIKLESMANSERWVGDLEIQASPGVDVAFSGYGACGIKGCQWVFERWEDELVVLLKHELFALLVTAGGVTTVVQTVDGDAAELVRRLFDWMEDESE